MLAKERIDLSAIERHQGLNQVVAVEQRMVIGGREIAERSRPERVFKAKVSFIERRDALNFRIGVGGEDGFQNGRKFGDAASEQIKILSRFTRTCSSVKFVVGAECR